MLRSLLVFLSIVLPSSAYAEEECIQRGDYTCWPSTCAVTLSEFENIRTRMFIWSVRGVVNCRGRLVSRSNYGKKSEVWRFDGKAPGSAMLVEFEGNLVRDTFQIGLE